MFLLAESGSTKTDWVEFDRDGIIKKFRTSGINPDIQHIEKIEQQLKVDLSNNLYYRQPERVFFYGAGLGGPYNRKLVEEMLLRVFETRDIAVEHDMLAAARACCFNQPGIVCILGTGSNSCFYDGENIETRIGGNGYLFGDEGSGADLGKFLMKKALDGELPDEIVQRLEEWVGLNIIQIRKEVHMADRPNVYLARLSRFIHANLDYPELKELTRERFREFLDKTVLRYPEEQAKHGTHVIGSIAHFYQKLLRKACQDKEVNLVKIVKNPAESLVQYHQNKI